MITKANLLLLLTELQEQGVDTTKEITKTVMSANIPIEVVKFINDKRELEISQFYTYIRKSYNQKKSKLYINIMKGIEEPAEVITTLASLELQILLFAKKLDNATMFLEHSRLSEICRVLLLYATKHDIVSCGKLLSLIKADIEAFEYVQGRRN